MALNVAAASPKLRRPKAFAIRTFPPLCGPPASSPSPPPAAGTLTGDRNVRPINLINHPPEPTSCGPGSDLLSPTENIKKSPISPAIRSFPEGRAPLVAAISKPSRSKEASAVGSGLEKITEGVVVGRSESNVKSSQVADDGEGDRRLCRAEGSDSKEEGEEKGSKLNDVVRRGATSDTGKISEGAVVRRSLSENDGEKLSRKSSSDLLKDGKRVSRPGSCESKKELKDTVKRIHKENSGSGNNVEKAVVGRSLGKVDGKKPSKKSPMPGLDEDCRSESSQLLDPRQGRLIVQALMVAKRCPWMQGNRRGSFGVQSKPKKAKIKENGNSAKK